MAEKSVYDFLLEKMDVLVQKAVENQFTVIYMIAVAFIVPWGRRVFMNFVHFGMFLKGCAGLVAPEKFLLVLMKGNIDEMHVMLFRGVSIMMILWALSYWLLMSSSDNTTHASFLWSFTVLYSLVFIALLYALTHTGGKKAQAKLDTEYLAYVPYAMAVVIVASTYYSLTNKDWGGYIETSSHANIHLRIDFFLLVVIGVMMFVAPQLVLKSIGMEKIDSVHSYLVRASAASCIAMGLTSGKAANFLYPFEKDCLMFSHLLLYIVAIAMDWYYIHANWNKVTWTAVGAEVVTDLVCFINCFGAMDRDLSVVSRVIIPLAKSRVRDNISWLRGLILRGH